MSVLDAGIEAIKRRVEKILMSVPEEPITTNMLARITKMSTPTVQKWVELISFIQNHYIRIEVITSDSGTKKFRQVRRIPSNFPTYYHPPSFLARRTEGAKQT